MADTMYCTTPSSNANPCTHTHMHAYTHTLLEACCKHCITSDKNNYCYAVQYAKHDQHLHSNGERKRTQKRTKKSLYYMIVPAAV